MKSLQELKDYFAKDRFATGNGITIDSVGEGAAVCSAALLAGHKNAMGVAQGGFVYTLADFCFAVASNWGRPNCVTLDSTIHFLRPASGSRLTARAAEVSGGKTVCVYRVTVEDDANRPVAEATFTGFTRREP